MTLDEWRQVQATEPATPNQVGALHHEFKRLGYQDNRWDRPARLGAAAALLHLGQLNSTHDLTMGQAGQLLRALRGYRSRTQLEMRLRQADPLPLAVRQNMATLFAVQWPRLGAS